MIEKIVIHNYRQFVKFEASFGGEMNILVGDNDTGKSTLLEAIHLALTCRVDGKVFAQALSPYHFNNTAFDEWILSLRAGKKVLPPEILIEIYFSEKPETAVLKGTNNSRNENAAGVRVRVSPDPNLA
jgi:putative ATP-dependent endonuclease of the OLD family